LCTNNLVALFGIQIHPTLTRRLALAVIAVAPREEWPVPGLVLTLRVL